MPIAAPSSLTDIFDLAQQRLDWASNREQILSQDIANADTPGYRPQDLAPFQASLGQFVVKPVMTNPRDLPGFTDSGSGALVEQTTDARAPDGNAVSVTDELARVADTDTTHRLVSEIYQKYVALYTTALDAKG